MTTNAIEGQPLPVYGDGKQIRDWLWVEDHCAGIELVLREGAPGEVYNVGGDDERENVEIVGHILRLTGADESLIRHVEDRAGHDRRYSLDTAKLRALGWEPQKAFEEGIAETVAWYLVQPELVGADQVGRVPGVLREAVRGSRLAGRPSPRRSSSPPPCAAA